jgi:hypothetical protein
MLQLFSLFPAEFGQTWVFNPVHLVIRIIPGLSVANQFELH